MITFIKRQIGGILTSKLLYKFAVKPAIRGGFLKTSVGLQCVENQSHYLQSLIFWNLYERSEVKLIKNFLEAGFPVIEFGASLGVTSSAICAKVGKTVTVISVEANPKLIYNLKQTKEKNNLANLTLVCAAVDYSGEAEISFILDDSNLGSRKGSSGNVVSVPAIKLSDIITAHHIGQFTLVCDIEGAELEMFLNETNVQVINACRQIIIELHATSYEGKLYQRSEIRDIILQKFNMKTVFTDGKTWVFKKSVTSE